MLLLLSVSAAGNLYQLSHAGNLRTELSELYTSRAHMRYGIANIKDVVDLHPPGAPVTEQLRQTIDGAYWGDVSQQVLDPLGILPVDQVTRPAGGE